MKFGFGIMVTYMFSPSKTTLGGKKLGQKNIGEKIGGQQNSKWEK